MFLAIKATKAANENALRAEAAFRASDPFEQAKLYLQQRGFHVFSHSLYAPHSTLTCVGTKKLERDEVIAMAERMRR